jgi:signal transduction protein with GAF and PtsI domain
MQKPIVTYETLLKITKAISVLRDPDEIVLVTVEGICSALKVKGCALFLLNPKHQKLELAGSFGLSEEYLRKGPVNALRSIPGALEDQQPVGIFDVTDDPRIQYPQAAVKEGIASILSVPISTARKLIGCMRIYTAEPWEFTLNDVNFVQAVAQLVGMALELCRVNHGLKESIDILKTMRDPSLFKSKRATFSEAVSKSLSSDVIPEAST